LASALPIRFHEFSWQASGVHDMIVLFDARMRTGGHSFSHAASLPRYCSLETQQVCSFPWVLKF
jgi:hypothetical protein